MSTNRVDVTIILKALSGGDERAADQLFPLVYDELRRLAEHSLQGKMAGQTLQATALVHEAYMRLVNDQGAKWEDRAYFFGTAAEAMRRILVERYRKKKRVKHGGERVRVPLSDADVTAAPVDETDWEALDRAVEALAAVDESACRVLKLRFYAGLSVEMTAMAMGVSEPTVKRNWAYARAWLCDYLRRNA